MIKYHSRMLSPVMDIEMSGSLVADEDDVVWIRNNIGVYALRKADISYKLSE